MFVFAPKSINKDATLLKALLPLGIIAAMFFACIVFITPVTILDSIKFLLFNLFFVYLFGFVLFSLFSGQQNDRSVFIVLGYPISIFIFILSSFLDDLFKFPWLLVFLLITISWYLLKNKKESFNFKPITTNFSSYWYIYIVFFATLFFQFLFFILPSTPFQDGSLRLIYQDSAWTVGNTWSLINYGYPLRDLRAPNITFGYHMLQNIYQYSCYKFTNINPVLIHFYLEPFFDTLNITLVAIFASKYLLKINFKICALFLIGLIFSSPFFLESYNLNFFVNPISLVFGLPFFLLFFLVLFSDIQGKTQFSIFYLAICFCNVVLTKAHLLIVLPLTVGIIAVYFYFTKKEATVKYLKLFLLLICFSVLIKSIFFSQNEGAIKLRFVNFSLEDVSVNNILQIDIKNYWKQWFINFRDMIFPFIAWWPCGFIVFLLFSKKSINRDSGVLISLFCIISISIVSVLDFVGGNIYFLWYSLIICLFAFLLSDEVILQKRPLQYLVLSGIIISMFQPVRDVYNWYKLGWGDFTDTRRVWDLRATISADEWTGMEWLKNNANKTDIILSDRNSFTHESIGDERSRFFYYSMVSGRQFYNEGDGFILSMKKRKLIDNYRKTAAQIYTSANSSSISDLLKESRINFIVVSKRFNNRKFDDFNFLNRVYSNKDLDIYKFNPALNSNSAL
jgi:hypothetical protein